MEALPGYGRDPLRTDHHARPDGAALHLVKTAPSGARKTDSRNNFLRVGNGCGAK